MNSRIVLVSVLNALVAVALAALLTVLLTSGPAGDPGAAADAPRASAADPAAGERQATDALPPSASGAAVTAERLKKDLMNREDLIPFEGRLGGTMGFYDSENIRILSDRWVYAQFDDGHVQGGMLLEYSVSADGEIRWRVIEARLE
jgi:hypothetical protein